MTWQIINADCVSTLRSLGDVDVLIADPPYSAHTHKKQWIGSALTSDGAPRVKTAHAGLGFDALTREQAEAVSAYSAAHVARWCLFFTDIEGIALWRECLADAGLEYVRSCIWDKVDGAPQFTGDRPAAGAEAIVCAHRPGKKRWNGGGRRNVFRYEVNGERGAKPHPSTKPLPLLIELVSLFSEPGETVLDPFCGSGTTGVAAVRLGRSFVGIDVSEQWSSVARERIEAETVGSTLNASRAGQTALFGVK